MLMEISKTKWFIEKAIKIHGDKYNYDNVNYINSNSIIDIICPIHGIYKQRARKHLEGSGCPYCGKEYNKKSYRTKEWFIAESKKVHGELYDYSKLEYKDFNTKVTINCRIHGDFIQSPRVHLKGCGCPKCGIIRTHNIQMKSTKTFINEANIIHNNYYDYHKVVYKGASKKVCIICPKHGKFWQTPTKHLRGHGCKKCRLKSQYRLYISIKRIIKDLIFECSPTWLRPQRFDMYSPMYNLAIEYNGIQHYVPIDSFGGLEEFIKTKQRDTLKRQICKQNNCKLFEIKYDYSDKDLDDIFNYIKTKQNEN